MSHGLMQFYAQLGLTNTVSHWLKFRNKDLSLKSEVFFCVILQKLPLRGLCNYEFKTIYLLQVFFSILHGYRKSLFMTSPCKKCPWFTFVLKQERQM